MEIIQRILEAYFEYVRFILEHIFGSFRNKRDCILMQS